MSNDGTTALVPIGQVVAELQQTFPDVTHSSLRFLERECLVVPARTPGGHRLYRQQDIERIRQIKAWQAQRLSLADIRQRLAEQQQLASPNVLGERFLATAIDGDRTGAVQLIRDADDLGMPLAELFGDVLRPALYEVGARWQAGNLPVGQEKEISALVRDLVAELSLRHADPDPRGPTIVAACVAGELHELGLQMIAGLLSAHGWRVHVLGADVDPSFLQERVQSRQPAAVLLSAMEPERMPAIANAIAAVRAPEACPGIPVVVGGQSVPSLADEIRACGAIPMENGDFGAVLQALCPEQGTSTGTDSAVYRANRGKGLKGASQSGSRRRAGRRW
jgi:methanogenic corrinoid protein MtbC1